MKKIKMLLALLLSLVFVCPSYGAVGIYKDGTPFSTATDLKFTTPGTAITTDGSTVSFNLLLAGVEDDISTSINSSTNNITDVGYAIIFKDIPSGNTAGSMVNGIPGQTITIQITADAGGTWSLAPLTRTGYAHLDFNDVGDLATLLYVNDTIGWIVISVNSVTIS